MEFLDDLSQAFFGALYTYRIPVAAGSVVAAIVVALLAWRMGLLGMARRHPGRAGVVLGLALVIGLPLTYYLASPIWVRSELVEPDPVAEAVARSTPAPTEPTVDEPTSEPSAATPSAAAPSQPATSVPTPAPFEPRVVASGPFHGTDDFHFGQGTARIIETEPGAFTLRLEDFSVRNGPDLFVYLSPDADGYTRKALEVGRLKATDGSFGYKLPAGTDPADFKSAIIWCKQFSHLFAVAPFDRG
ncbi:MAG: DM13 domain-containing protein [Chloroflexi bacterium]|nr:DM13 domain-containing protein [Chloroflexota bacterium]